MTTQWALVHAVREPKSLSREAAPVLLLLHGVGSNEQDLMSLAPYLDDRFFVVSARAPIALQHGSYAWYHVQQTPGGGFHYDAQEAEDSRRKILEFVDQLTSSYNVDAERVFLMGFSQGCIMSLAAALTEPKRFSGVVGLSGRLLPDLAERAAPQEQLQGLPILLVHGTQDSVISIEYGRAIRDYLQSLPVDMKYLEYTMGHTINQQAVQEVDTWLERQLDRTDDWRDPAKT